MTNGRKLGKITLESKSNISLYGGIEGLGDGDNRYYFMTSYNKNTCKTPIGMFENYEIPNSLKLVDDSIREYYSMN